MLTGQDQPFTYGAANSYSYSGTTSGQYLDGSKESAVANYSNLQALTLPLLQPIEFCNRPEIHLEEAAKHYLPPGCYEDADAYERRLRYAYSSFQPFYANLKAIAIGPALRKPIVLAEESSDAE